MGAASPSTSRARWTPKPSGSMRPAPVSWACTRTPAARPTAFCGRGQLHRPRRPGRAEHPSLRDQCGRHHHRGQIRGHQRHGPRLCVAGGQLHRPRRPGRAGYPSLGINAAGTIVVGMYTDSSGTEHGFVWQGGSFTSPFDFPGAPEPWGSMRLAPSSWAGTGTPAARTTDFLCGAVNSSDFPGARSTQALGINAAGTIIVGMYADSSTTHGFVIP